MIRKFVKSTCEFQGIHYWKDCDIKEVDFLKYPHRHLFKVITQIQVNSGNREIEFIMLKNKILNIINNLYKNISDSFIKYVGEDSCEMIGEKILNELKKEYYRNGYIKVEVLEDGENGGIVEFILEKDNNIPKVEDMRR